MTTEKLDSLLLKSQQGDQLAFENFLIIVADLTLPFLRKKQIPEFDQHDILQNTLMAVHRSLPTYHPTHSVKAWLFAIIRYKVMDYFRQKYRINAEELTEELDLSLLSHSLEDDYIASERTELLETALSKLTHTQQTIIRLMKLEGLSIKEVSQILKISESNVKIQAFRGYKKLAKLLGSRAAFFVCIFLLGLSDLTNKGA